MRSSGPRHRGNHAERRGDEPPQNGGPHTERGPNGYRRPDQQIVEDACQCLELDGDVDATEIDVTCEHGIITLSGTVDSRQAKRRAEECVECVHGVKDVMNLLRVAVLEQQADSRTDERPSVGAIAAPKRPTARMKAADEAITAAARGTSRTEGWTT